MFPAFFNQGSLQSELNSFYERLHDNPLELQHVSKSAFSHARKKIDLKVYDALNQTLLKDAAPLFLNKRFHGFRILGIDGSIAALPDYGELKDHFGIWDSEGKRSGPRARLSMLYDCLNQVSYHHEISAKSIGERELAYRHIQTMEFSQDDIICLDRGYPCFWLFHKIKASGAHFCARMSNTWNDVKEFKADKNRRDEIMTIPIRKYAEKECLEHGVDQNEITLRLVKVELPSGEIEVLATSIEDDSKDSLWFKQLYNLRWQTEEFYRVIKQRVRIQNFTARTAHGVQQEFFAKVLMVNITSLIRTVTEMSVSSALSSSHKPKCDALKVNFTAALSKMKRLGPLLFFGKTIETLKALCIKMVEDLTLVIWGRSYPRIKRSLQGHKQTYPYL